MMMITTIVIMKERLCRDLDLTAAVTDDVNDHVRCFFSSDKMLSPVQLGNLYEDSVSGSQTLVHMNDQMSDVKFF